MDASIVVAVITAVGSILAIIIRDLLSSKKRQDKLIDKINQKIDDKISKTDNKINELTINTNKKIDALEQRIIITRNQELEELRKSDTKAKEGIQAILRDRLLQLYRYCTEVRCKGIISKAYSTDDEKKNFENMYSKYHALGQNGVMDVKYEHFMQLPDYEPNSTTKTTRKKTVSKSVSK